MLSHSCYIVGLASLFIILDLPSSMGSLISVRQLYLATSCRTCKYTPTISSFDLEKDQESFSRVTEKLMTDEGVKITQNRFLIIARKDK